MPPLNVSASTDLQTYHLQIFQGQKMQLGEGSSERAISFTQTVVSPPFAIGHCWRIPDPKPPRALCPFALTVDLPDTHWSHTQDQRGKRKTGSYLGNSSWIFLTWLCQCLWNCRGNIMWPLGKSILEPHYLNSDPSSRAFKLAHI
jgi:hypothetical protein